MNRSLTTLIFCMSLAGEILAWDFRFRQENHALEYEDPYQDRFLYLHMYINYSYNIFWQNDWEEKYFSRNGFRLSVGSVTTDELMVDGQLAINEDLGSGWRFRGEGTMLATRHLNAREESAFMGFERNLYKNLSIFLLANPSFDKEETDASLGFLLTDNQREQYIRIALIPEDFVYQEKNDQGGISLKNPYALEWFLRFGKDRWRFYSEGRYSTGFEREFPDKEASPELGFHQQQINAFRVKVYYLPAASAIIGASLYHYYFEETKRFTAAEQNYFYTNEIYDAALEAIIPFKTQNRFRLLSHYVFQKAASAGFNAHDFERDDWLLGFFYERIFSRHIVDAGYMFTSFGWDYKALAGQGNYSRNGYVDKVKLGWTYSFKKIAQINISISHQLNIGGFGGANLQYIMFF